MPIIKSAKKRVRRAQAQAIANSRTKRTMRAKIKAFYADITAKKDSTKSQSEAYSALDTAVKKNVISQNRAARKKSQINRDSKAAGTTKVGAKKAAKKVPAKKPASTKKATTKKTTKKPAAKKPAAKKSATKK